MATLQTAPLLLPTFALLPPAHFALTTKLFYIFIDLLCAHALMQIADSGQSGSSRLFTSARKDIRWDGIAIGAAQVEATKPPHSSWKFAVLQTVFFAAGVGWLLYMSYVLTGGSWEFLSSTYGVQLLLPDLTPNVGLWWYFFIEMFDPFREFFLGVFWLHLAGYVGGLCIRLRNQPLFIVTTMLGLFAIFKPYPTISDTCLYFAMLPLYRHVFPLMRYTFFAMSAILYATLLGPAFYHLWIYAGSGNANFFYAITLVWSLGLVLLLADSLFAVLRDEWEVERPEMKGKDIRQI
ncbi:MAG: hypothetical protein Q9163_003892 [Psora crenata]